MLNNKLNYWKEKLNGIEPLQLPADYPRPPVQSTKGTTTIFAINKDITDQIKELSRQHESTLFMTLLAAFKVLLHRYTGQQDICIGTSIAGRQQQEIENLIGFFVNILALRTYIDEGISFTGLLEKVKQTTLEAYEHQEVPFEKVVDAVVKERDISRTPLFQVLFVMLNTPEAQETALGGLALSGMQFEHTSSKYDITFFVRETPQGLSGSVEYSTELFNEQTISRMMSQFNMLLEAVIAHPGQNISLFPLMTRAEENQLLIEFNNTESLYPEDKTIIDLFEEQVSKAPDAIALIFGDASITYHQLNERANQLGYYLKNKGVSKNASVVLSVERSVEMMVAILGILKAGGAYVPLDPGYPAERIGFMLEDTASDIIITTKNLRPGFTNAGSVQIIEIDTEWDLISKQNKDNISTYVDSDDLAYVIYTSGSTGRPKGVMVTQKNVVSLVKGVDFVSLTNDDILLSTGSSSFDATTIEYWGMLLNGGLLILCADSTLLDHKLLKEEINSRRVNKMWFTSGWFNQLVDADITIFENLETILVGGEKLSPRHIEKLRKTYPEIEVINGYGPTENTTFSLTYRITDKETNTPIPIGRPLNNRSAFILDEHHQLVPLGVSGEICLSGDGLSKGYLNRPELTAEKFIDNPYCEGRMYKTGDVGRWLPDGNIEYLGRKDDQVKIRGYRIEMGEIESVLQECDQVKDAAIITRTDQEDTKRLVAYIVPNGDFDKPAIQYYLKNKLPDYMIPALFVEMESLPLNANGKVDRKALPDPEITEEAGDEYVAPSSEQEKILVKIWEELLDLERVGVHDNFFEIGGDSLLAIRVVSAIRKKLGVEMPISNLFEFQTVSTLATKLRTQSNGALLPVIQKATRPQRIPLSFSQERLWFIDRLEGSLQYHIPAVMRLKGDLNMNALEHALSSIVNRHEVLRTVFLEHDGDAYQFVKDYANWALPLVDGVKYENDLSALQQLIQKLINATFDLSKDNMLRAHVIKLSDHEHILLVTLHHIASDGWSRSILVKEVAELYTAFEEGRETALADLPIQYADFSIWQRNYLTDEVLGKKMAYWQNKLEGIEPLQMPLDFARPPIQTSRGASAPFTFDKQLSNALAQLSREKGTTLFMTLLAALKVLLYRYSGQKDICIGTGTAGRQQQEVEDLIGFFINTLALRTELNTDGSFTTLLQDVRKTTVEAYENQEVPFEKVVDAVVRKRDRSRNPLFQVMFVLQNTPEVPSLKLGKLQLERAGYEHTTAQFDLSFSITENDRGLSGSLEYNVDLFTKQTVSRIIEHFRELLGSIIKSPEQKISDLPILGANEEHQLMEDFNDTYSAYPQNKSIADLFVEQVAKTPEATAVVFMNQSLTYKQLDERSNQLANYLVDIGIKPGDNVGLLSSRRLEMIIGIFGIIKTGAAYVPFNTEYPAERLQYVVENAGIKHIVYTDIELVKLYEFSNCECVDLDKSFEYQTEINPVKVPIDSPVYIMYTSGTTGRPKGISVSNRNVIKLVYELGDIAVKPWDRMLQWSNYAFDGCVYEIYSSLLKGAGLYLVKDEWASDVYELGKVMKEQKINMCFITTALFNTFVDVNPDMLKGLRKILFGGEMVSLSHVRKALEVIGQEKIVHVYGPTETTVYATFSPLNVIGEDGIIPIGKPLANTQLYVLDAYSHLVPIGALGELYIGGDGVSLGYVNNDALTLEKFVNIPGINNEKRLYRTGDLVRMLPDGNIVYIGRIDNQVKIRGYRIEPGEIENLLQESDMISKAVVMVRESIDLNKSLVGYIVPGESYNKQLLVSWLQSKLPEYMIPALWVEMERFPLNPNGKIDKKALPDPDVTDMPSNVHKEASTEIERKLVNIWQDILSKKRIGINDNFFELGGHSLLAMRLISAVRKELEVELAVKELFLNPTISELGSHLQKQKKVSLLPAIEAYPRPKHIPLSFSQERLWFVDQLEGSIQYNSPMVLRLKGELNNGALSYAVQNIISRHEVLRTVFYEADGKPYQSITNSGGWKLSEVDGLAYRDDRNALQNFIEKLIVTPFNLAKDYMLRAHLIEVEKDDHVLVGVMHHIASDGWSVPIIVREVQELYNAYLEKRSPALPELSVQFADYAIWQRKYLGGEIFDRRIEYWKKKLDGVAALQLPTDFNRPAVRTIRGASFNFMIEKELSDQLNELSRRHGTTLYMVLLATYKILLQRYSGQGDICVGASIANRPQKELEELIGFFVNTLALRTWVDETTAFSEFLQKVKTTTLEAYENQDVPFEKVVEEVVKERDPARSPLFQVMLVLLNTPETSKLGLGNVALSQEAFEIKISKFDFTFHVSQSEYGLPVTVVYNTDLYSKDTIGRMSGHFKQLLNSVVKHPLQSIELLQMLTEAEEQQLLVEFN